MFLALTPLVELEVPVGSTLASRAVATAVAAQLQLQITVLVGTIFKDFCEGQSGVLLHARSVLLPAGGGSPTLALAPELILEAPELCSSQFGQPPHDLLYHLQPPYSIGVRRHHDYTHGPGHGDPVPGVWRFLR
jgi:hypothetical protein